MLVALLTAASLIITIFNYHEAPKSVPIWWDLHGGCQLHLSKMCLSCVSGFGDTEREREKESVWMEDVFGVCSPRIWRFMWGEFFSPVFLGLSASVCDVVVMCFEDFVRVRHPWIFLRPECRRGFWDSRSKDVADHVQLRPPFGAGGRWKSPWRLCGLKCFGRSVCVWCDFLWFHVLANFLPSPRTFKGSKGFWRVFWRDSRAVVVVPSRNFDCGSCQVVFLDTNNDALGEATLLQ